MIAAAVLWLSNMDSQASDALHILPGIFATAFGFGLGLTLTAVRGVRAEESGVASALLNASQQIGVALGLGVLSAVVVVTATATLPNALSAVYEGRAAGNERSVARASDALVQGYDRGLLVGALVLAVAAVITALVIDAKPQPQNAEQHLHR
ncbi:hypothetical protein [Deinococcus yavapaiensis]|nr:hypothetical protein [Deinococcus yavapaiensis]